MSDKTVLYTAVYDDVKSAVADLDHLDQLHREGLVGTCDAAVIEWKEGWPHVVKRLDRPRVRVIPEVFGSGALPRHDLHEATKALPADKVGLIAVGELTFDKAINEAITLATKVAKREFDAAADELSRELSGAFTS